MNARRPGVSAVLLDEYFAGVSANSNPCPQEGSATLGVLHAACASCVTLSPAPRFDTIFWMREVVM